ncbi:hypothetical protein NG895_12980 [Aeoliella sp. ICT_H6.2]|uniref:Uncharacterized protein n=1 Tax=Aeoliella straminimaris TaxID=2954799 RepID=A0A9X2JJB5_9BACT|nr:hypothetical protein [Aeoliella straminimaris]
MATILIDNATADLPITVSERCEYRPETVLRRTVKGQQGRDMKICVTALCREFRHGGMKVVSLPKLHQWRIMRR